ncbi:hypothetical protein BJF78_20825 [Pseudonocardia sp. CNS-139]|nr:hypothetical protein BJF78_20825 [Pseudonocardia sp. CNS-139]
MGDRNARGARSVAGAVLLALPGVGLGYAYLGRRVRAAVQLAGAVGIGVLAAATDAAGSPGLWWPVAGVWCAAGAVDTWRLARRTGPGAPWRRPVAAGALVTAAAVAGFLLYADAAGAPTTTASRRWAGATAWPRRTGSPRWTAATS